MSKNIIKSIPYGVTDFEAIRREKAYYVDKTSFIEKIENAGKYLFFIRPRRFGKSLLLSVLESYYDVLKADQFDLLFKGTDIYNQPTTERNSYLVLKFNFSAVEPLPKRLETSFLNRVRTSIESFLYRYGEFLAHPRKENLIEELPNIQSSADMLLRLVDLCGFLKQKVFIIIDEYDNFTNTIISTSGNAIYENMTHGEGFFKAFFNVLKEGTTGTDAPISRLFITGVSPVTLDDVTSGFNIGKNISTKPEFNQMLGFTETEVSEMIEYYRQQGMVKDSTPYLLNLMRQWYDNYRFSKDSDTTLFNSDMVLYFMDDYLRSGKIPDELIDRNVRIDYGKLKHLIIIDDGKEKVVNGNFSRLKQIIADGSIKTRKIEDGFPVGKLTHTKNFLSLLFYFGLLTIKEMQHEELLLSIPNETARTLYYDYISEAYEETGTFSIDMYEYERFMHAMAYKGEWEPLINYIAKRMKESMGLRDLITGEKSIQAFLNVYLGLSQLYIIQAEKELNKGFADIVMIPFSARYREIKFAYLLELKYLKKKDQETGLETAVKSAKEQLAQYALDKKLKKAVENMTLIKLVLVFSGTELIYREAVN